MTSRTQPRPRGTPRHLHRLKGWPIFTHLRFLAIVALALFLSLSLAACSRSNEPEASPDVRISLIPAPEGKDGEYLTVVLMDAGGQPITDARVSLEGNMSHAGMVPVITEEVRDADDGDADGRYRVPFRFTMLGDWIVTVSAQLADGAQVQEDVNLTVTAEEVKTR